MERMRSSREARSPRCISIAGLLICDMSSDGGRKGNMHEHRSSRSSSLLAIPCRHAGTATLTAAHDSASVLAAHRAHSELLILDTHVTPT
jgi:hypothetical protein